MLTPKHFLALFNSIKGNLFLIAILSVSALSGELHPNSHLLWVCSKAAGRGTLSVGHEPKKAPRTESHSPSRWQAGGLGRPSLSLGHLDGCICYMHPAQGSLTLHVLWRSSHQEEPAPLLGCLVSTDTKD